MSYCMFPFFFNCTTEGLGRKFSEIVQYAAAFVGAMIYSLIASWQITLLIFAISPILVVSMYYLIQIVSTQTTRANATYAKAGSVVSTAVSAIRTVLSLNAVEKLVDLYKDATTEGRDTSIRNAWVAGFAYGSNYVTMLFAYMLVTLFGAFLLYRGVRETGCDPSATVEGAEGCDPSGLDVFGALMGVSIAAAVVPLISISLEAFAGKSNWFSEHVRPIFSNIGRRLNEYLSFFLLKAPALHVTQQSWL